MDTNLKNLTDAENQTLNQVSLFGSDAYPIRKVGQKFAIDQFYGITITDQLQPSRKAAVRVVESYLTMLRIRKAYYARRDAGQLFVK